MIPRLVSVASVLAAMLLLPAAARAEFVHIEMKIVGMD
jgi:hypothetical protein